MSTSQPIGQTLEVDLPALKSAAAKVKSIATAVDEVGSAFQRLAEKQSADVKKFNESSQECHGRLKSYGASLEACGTSMTTLRNSVENNFQSNIAAQAYYDSHNQVISAISQVNSQLAVSTADLAKVTADVNTFYTRQSTDITNMGTDIKTKVATKLDGVETYLNEAVQRFADADAAGGH